MLEVYKRHCGPVPRVGEIFHYDKNQFVCFKVVADWIYAIDTNAVVDDNFNASIARFDLGYFVFTQEGTFLRATVRHSIPAEVVPEFSDAFIWEGQTHVCVGVSTGQHIIYAVKSGEPIDKQIAKFGERLEFLFTRVVVFDLHDYYWKRR